MNFPLRAAAVGGLILIVILAVAAWIFLVWQSPPGEAGTWSGVDETVIEKYAAEAGREAQEPYINTDKGDLLLFVFALGGAVGGFIAGYYWRKIMGEKR